MSNTYSVLSVDIGASSGRVFRVDYDGDLLTLHEQHRFLNGATKIGECLYWDIMHVYSEVKNGIKNSINSAEPWNEIRSIGIDTWGNDFVLLDNYGCLMENAYSYRDDRTIGVFDKLNNNINSRDLYQRNGIQQVRMNTFYQLVSLLYNRPYILEHARDLLFIPDFLTYLFTGQKKNEYTLATISQLYNYEQKDWDRELIKVLNLPEKIFHSIISPGEIIGSLKTDLIGVNSCRPIPFIAVGGHDTASAVAAIPNTKKSTIHISSGTWSIVGIETQEPIINETTYKFNFSNEGTVDQKIRLQKNVMGLWIFNELKHQFADNGKIYTDSQMVEMAQQASPFGSVINPDDDLFYGTGNMIDNIICYCDKMNQAIPSNDNEIIRCVLESLALKYRFIIEQFESIMDDTYNNINIIGGGIKNKFLTQLVSDYTSKVIFAGPVEATALGNAIVQFIALGAIKNIEEGRKLILKSFPPQKYEPNTTEYHEKHYKRFLEITNLKN